jgi:GT2 family glycosyltransferase
MGKQILISLFEMQVFLEIKDGKFAAEIFSSDDIGETDAYAFHLFKDGCRVEAERLVKKEKHVFQFSPLSGEYRAQGFLRTANGQVKQGVSNPVRIPSPPNDSSASPVVSTAGKKSVFDGGKALVAHIKINMLEKQLEEKNKEIETLKTGLLDSGKKLEEMRKEKRFMSSTPFYAITKVSVIVLIYNNADIIGRFLQTLFEHCRCYLHEVIVVDNASTDEPLKVISKFPTVKYVRNAKNGCSSGRNLGVEHASSETIAFFDSDQWFTSGNGFAEAIGILTSNPSIGAVSWAAGFFRSSSDFSGPIGENMPEWGMSGDEFIHMGYRTDFSYLATCGFFMRRKLFWETGGFDTFYDPTCFEDTDLSMKIREAGFELAYRRLSGVMHQPHQTTGASTENSKYMALFKRNHDYFKAKWSGKKHLIKTTAGACC